MTEKPTRLEVCCDPTCPNHNVPQVIELTVEEIAQREADNLAYEAQQAAQKAAEETTAALKKSAKAKLVAGQPLTEEEAATLVI
jgi:hypothetical protein